MKILLVEHHNDYEAVDFQQTYYGQSVRDLITKVENGKALVGEAGELPVKIVTIPEQTISKEFINFIRNEVQDYEHSKHCNFYLEGETVIN